jgi:hypothetical protein
VNPTSRCPNTRHFQAGTIAAVRCGLIGLLPVLLTLTALPSPAATFTVVSFADSGTGSLREAITLANSNSGPDTINFASPGTISLVTGLFTITDDATTILGGGSIVLEGSATGGGADGLGIFSSNNVIEGLTIVSFSGSGIQIFGGTTNTIKGCNIGTDGVSDLGNEVFGILIQGGANNIIGGTTAADRNIISGNDGNGIVIQGTGASGNKVTGNFIGLNALGDTAIPNGSSGISISGDGTGNIIGGATAGERNIISGNSLDGVTITGASAIAKVIGNFIGTNAAGQSAIANTGRGVAIGSSDNCPIGGVVAGEENVISGNGSDGILIHSGSSFIEIFGNNIGVAADDVTSLANAQNGMSVDASSTILIGNGTAAGVNIIANNLKNGIEALGSLATGVDINRNSIFSNVLDGIALSSGANHNKIPPTITGTFPITGRGSAGDRVDLFVGQGKIFIDSVTIDNFGDFTSSADLTPFDGSNLIALATNTLGDTSEFSAPAPISATAPVVQSITRDDPGTTNLAIVAFTVTFNESVTGVSTADFALTVAGITGASVVSVNGTGAAYTISVNTGTGNGTLRLDVTDDDTIQDVDSEPLGGAGAGNGNFPFGQIYVIDKTEPIAAITSVTPATTLMSPIPYICKFNESVTGFSNLDISCDNGQVTDFKGSGADYAFKIVPDAPGVVNVHLEAGVATDIAGNGNAQSPTISRTFAPDTRGSIIGRVVNASTEEPVTCAAILATSTKGAELLIGVADANGDYRIDDVLPGAYTLTLFAAGFSAAPANVTVTGGFTKRQNFLATALSAGATISGQITDADTGQPLVGAKVDLFSNAVLVDTTFTCAGGRYEFRLSSGKGETQFQVTVSSDNYVTESVDVSSNGVDPVEQDVALEKSALTPGALVVTVIDGDTAGPLAGAEVIVRGDIDIAGTAEDNGICNFDALVAGTYTVIASAPGYQGALRVENVVPGVNDVSITLEPGLTALLPEDIDGNGTLDAVDVQIVINAALGIDDRPNADVNIDGEVNAVDVQLVINAALGLKRSGA